MTMGGCPHTAQHAGARRALPVEPLRLGKDGRHGVPCAECEEVTGSGTGGRAGAGPGAAWQVRGASTCLALRVSSALSYKTPRPLSVC